MALIQSIARYLKQDIWRVQIKKLSRGKSMIVRLVRTTLQSSKDNILLKDL